MNLSFYLFGDSDHGYMQYVHDNSENIFSKAIALSKDKSQLVVHKEPNLTYYSYVYKLNDTSTIGLGVILNQVQVVDIAALLEIFQDTLNIALCDRDIFKRDTDQFEYVVSSFSENASLYDHLASFIKEKLSDSSIATEVLKAYNYESIIGSVKTFSSLSNNEDIIRSCDSNDYVVVVDTYEPFISSINIDNKEKTIKKEDNASDNGRIISTVLGVLCAVLLIIVIFLYKSLSSYKEDVKTYNSRLSTLGQEVSSCEYRIKDKESIINEKELIIQRKDRFIKEISNNYPLYISDVEIANVNNSGEIDVPYGDAIYSYRTMYLQPRITYSGYAIGDDVTLFVKLITPNGRISTGSSSPSGFSFSSSFEIKQGTNTVELTGWGSSSKGHYDSGYYEFQFWYKGMMLCSKTFYIY